MNELLVQFISPAGNTSQHTIYCKRHSVRQPSKHIPNDKTLFTTSWPPYCGKEEIKEIFSRIGKVDDVYLSEESVSVENYVPSGRFAVGYVVFQEEDEVTRALSLCNGVAISCCIGRVGLDKWCTDYQGRYPSEKALRERAEKGIAAYDDWMDKEMKKKKRLSEPDEEGWITVTTKTPLIERPKRKKRKKELNLKLYNFQQREAQRERVAELRKKFQEDRELIASMKANRKFKPF